MKSSPTSLVHFRWCCTITSQTMLMSMSLLPCWHGDKAGWRSMASQMWIGLQRWCCKTGTCEWCLLHEIVGSYVKNLTWLVIIMFIGTMTNVVSVVLAYFALSIHCCHEASRWDVAFAQQIGGSCWVWACVSLNVSVTSVHCFFSSALLLCQLFKWRNQSGDDYY